MACVNPDGSLSSSGRAMLKALESPRTAEEVAAEAAQPLFKVRSSLREMSGAGLIRQDGEKFVTTDAGRAMLARS